MKSKMMILILFLSFTSKGLTAELYEFYTGVRALGMGGAAVAVVNDETALVSNPAALGKLRNSFLTLIDPEVHATGNISELSRGRQTSEFQTPQGLLNILKQNPGKHFHSKVQVFPSFVVPNFGIGLLGKYEYNASVTSNGATYNFDYTNDYALVMGFNFRIWDGRIKLGFNGRAVNRVEARSSLDPNSTALDLGGLVTEGLGVGSDVGLIFTMPWAWLPTLSAVARDVGHTKYDLSSGLIFKPANRPQLTNQSVDVGFSLSPIIGQKGFRAQITGEYRGVTSYSTETDHARRTHVGIEFNLGDVFFIRGGMNQRYWTAGFEFSMAKFQFQLATYGEEIGTATATKEDRRYVGKFSFRL